MHKHIYTLYLLLLENNLHGFIWPGDGILEHTLVLLVNHSSQVEIKAILSDLMFSYFFYLQVRKILANWLLALSTA